MYCNASFNTAKLCPLVKSTMNITQSRLASRSCSVRGNSSQVFLNGRKKIVLIFFLSFQYQIYSSKHCNRNGQKNDGQLTFSHIGRCVVPELELMYVYHILVSQPAKADKNQNPCKQQFNRTDTVHR